MILNVTRGTILCRRVEVAATPFRQLRGLMFRRRLEGGMLFLLKRERRVDIWTFGMLFPIDIIWIDGGLQVVCIKEHALPWRYIGFPPTKATMVLEVRAGVVKKTRTVVGDTLSIAGKKLPVR